jgi:hypothetical protein
MRKTSDLLDLLSEKFLKFSYQNEAKTTSSTLDGVKTKYDQRGCDTETFDAKSQLANSFNLSRQGMKLLARGINKTPQLKCKRVRFCNLFCAFLGRTVPILLNFAKKFKILIGVGTILKG